MSKSESMAGAEKKPENSGSASIAGMVEDVVGCKWSLRLLELVADECVRPGALLRACEGLSAKVMNERLRKMVRFGIMRRSVFGDKPPLEVQYELTAFGGRFRRVIEEIRCLQNDFEELNRADSSPRPASKANSSEKKGKGESRWER